MQESKPKGNILQNIGLIIGGLGVGVLLIWGMTALFPGLLPNNDPEERREVGTTADLEFRVSDGDLYYWLAGKIRPPDDDIILSQHTVTWDEDGFRLPQWQSDSYPIALIGDSFSEGINVATPYPDLLAQQLGVPIRNYSYRGYGPVEFQKLGPEFVALENRTWLIYAYFSGNDLNDIKHLDGGLPDIRTSDWNTPWVIRNITGQAPSAQESEDGNYDYPMPVLIGGNYYELAFADDYFWWQIAPEGGFEGNFSWNYLSETLDILEESVKPETCRAMLFIPNKPQLYYQYIHEGVRPFFLGVGKQIVVGEEGLLTPEEHPYTMEDEPEIMAHILDQRDAIARLAEEKGWIFIDLYPAFREAVDNGELLYYPYDTHWNPAGHELAAQVIAEAMQSHTECPLAFD